MSKARQSRRLARTVAERLGAAAGVEAVEDFASGGPVPDETPTAAELRATLGDGQCGWDEAAINAGAAAIDHCPSGLESVYYAAYERAARETVERLAAALEGA